MTKARDLADFIASGTIAQTVTADGVDVGDNERIRLGDSQDLQLFHNGSASYITDSGTGNLVLQTSSALVVQNSAGTETMLQAFENGAVNLYHDNSVKIATTSTGVDVTGTVKIGGTDVISNARALTNIASIDATTAASISAAGVGGGGEADFVASGAIANGDVVSLNSDGTVSVTEQTTVSDSVGTTATFESASINYVTAAYDSSNDKVVVVYRDNANSYYLTAAVGSISGTSISFGTPVQVDGSGGEENLNGVVFDSGSNKIVIAYRYSASGNGRVIVGTVSGTSISFGSPTNFASLINDPAVAYDSVNNKTVIFYKRGNALKAIVATVSGTSVSVGTEVNADSNSPSSMWAVYDSSSGNIVCTYRNNSSGAYGTAIVGTVSGTSISFGSPVVYKSAGVDEWQKVVYDSVNNKIVPVYGYNSNVEAVVGTVSGTSISFGTAVASTTGLPLYISATYNSTSGKIVAGYELFSNSDAQVVTITVSGTTLSFGTPITTNTGSVNQFTGITSDPSSNKVVFAYPESSVGSANVFAVGYALTNAGSYIGVSTEAISDTATGAITIDGGINEGQTGLTIGSTYYVADDGSLSTTNNGRKIGKAISATKLLVNSNMSGDEMNTYLGGLV